MGKLCSRPASFCSQLSNPRHATLLSAGVMFTLERLPDGPIAFNGVKSVWQQLKNGTCTFLVWHTAFPSMTELTTWAALCQTEWLDLPLRMNGTSSVTCESRKESLALQHRTGLSTCVHLFTTSLHVLCCSAGYFFQDFCDVSGAIRCHFEHQQLNLLFGKGCRGPRTFQTWLSRFHDSQSPYNSAWNHVWTKLYRSCDQLNF